MHTLPLSDDGGRDGGRDGRGRTRRLLSRGVLGAVLTRGVVISIAGSLPPSLPALPSSAVFLTVKLGQ